jgi:hypothetical protein
MGAADGVVGHLAAAQRIVRVAEHVVDVPLERVATPKQGADLSVAWDDPISVAKRCSRADDRGLFSERADVERDAALSLNPLEPIVDEAGSDHRLVERNHLVDRQAWVELWVEASVVSYDVHVPPQMSTASFLLP